MVMVKVKRLRDGATLPSYSHAGDAGLNLFSCENYALKAGERRTFMIGLAMETDPGYVFIIKDRSGMAAKHGITTLAGVIEHTYRGEFGVVLLNTGDEEYAVRKGDRIAQMLVLPVATADVVEADDLSDTARGAGGFGSTGK
ncbi:dUTP diphosphatase [Candidatus Woesearchaeota archaeon]|nr:dUTP diphosphatase [Candidatus Woesearchaeota archaeon]